MTTGTRVIVTGTDTGFGRELRLGLEDRGATVIAVEGPFPTRAETDRRFAAVGPFDALVHAWVDEHALAVDELTALDGDEWRSRSSDLIRAALFCTQAARSGFGGRSGRIVLVTPTIGMTGAAGLVGYATAVEGMRALAKSAARQWGAEGITVNCVAPDVALLRSDGEPAEPWIATPSRPGTGVRTDVAAVVAMLLDPAAQVLTGTTLPVDGGTVMVP